jgi:ribosomal protein S13
MNRAEKSKILPIGQTHPQKNLPNTTVAITVTNDIRRAVRTRLPERTRPRRMRGSRLKKKFFVMSSVNGKETRQNRRRKNRKKKLCMKILRWGISCFFESAVFILSSREI